MKTVDEVWLQAEQAHALALCKRVRLQLANCCAAALDMNDMAEELMALPPAEVACDCVAHLGDVVRSTPVCSLHD